MYFAIFIKKRGIMYVFVLSLQELNVLVVCVLLFVVVVFQKNIVRGGWLISASDI